MECRLPSSTKAPDDPIGTGWLLSRTFGRDLQISWPSPLHVIDRGEMQKAKVKFMQIPNQMVPRPRSAETTQSYHEPSPLPQQLPYKRVKTINYTLMYSQVSIAEQHRDNCLGRRLLWLRQISSSSPHGPTPGGDSDIMYYQTLSLLCGHRIRWTMHSCSTHYSLLFSTDVQPCPQKTKMGTEWRWWFVIKEMINNGSGGFYNTAIIVNLLETDLTAPRWNNITTSFSHSLLVSSSHRSSDFISLKCWGRAWSYEKRGESAEIRIGFM